MMWFLTNILMEGNFCVLATIFFNLFGIIHVFAEKMPPEVHSCFILQRLPDDEANSN